MSELLPADSLVPVPLHPTRQRQRGFNQAFVLAEAVARITGLEIIEPLIRSRKTISQVSLGADDRTRNVENAFALKPNVDVAGKSLILVDDVITTGATLAACASLLHQGGAQSPKVATIAREMG